MNSREILVRSKYLELGMAINCEPTLENRNPIDSQLNSLSSEEKRRAKRKFRKQWRKCMRTHEDKELASSCFGAGGAKFDESCRTRRRIEVHKHVHTLVKLEEKP